MNYLSIPVSKITKTIFLTLILQVAFTSGICHAIEAPDCLKDSKSNTTVNKGNIDINSKDDFKEFLVPESVSSESPTVEKKVSVDSFNDDINTPKENYDLAKMYEKNNNSELALKYYKKAIKLNSEYESAYKGLARVQEKMGLLDDASSTYLNLSAMYEEMGMVEYAKKCRQEAAKINPNSATAQKALKTAIGEEKIESSYSPNVQPGYATARRDYEVLQGRWMCGSETCRISGNTLRATTFYDSSSDKLVIECKIKIDEKNKKILLYDVFAQNLYSGVIKGKKEAIKQIIWPYSIQDSNVIELNGYKYTKQ